MKRLQPGTLGGRRETESFGKMVSAVRHNCSTLGGNSGSALLYLESREVPALHFGGRYGVVNYGVPASELARDQRVVDSGVTFADQPPGGEPTWADWWKSADEALHSPGSVTRGIRVERRLGPTRRRRLICGQLRAPGRRGRLILLCRST